MTAPDLHVTCVTQKIRHLNNKTNVEHNFDLCLCGLQEKLEPLMGGVSGEQSYVLQRS